MEYPGSKFTRPWRVAMLVFFITAFLVISPILVLYTSGYRYDFKNGIIKEIGAISVDITPKNASVFLNDMKISEKMPIRLKNVLPGKYKIKISADGFYDWEKEVTVENKQTIYIKEIKLLKKSSPEKIADGQTEDISLSPDNRFLVYKKTDENGQGFFLLDLNGNKTTDLITDEDKTKKYTVSWFENADIFILAAADNSKISIIDPINADKNLDLAKEEKNKIIKWQWSNSYDPEIYYSTKSQILKFNIADRQKIVIGKNTFSDWLVDNRQIWGIQPSASTELESAVIRDAFGATEKWLTLSHTNAGDENNGWIFMKTTEDRILLKKSNQSEMLLAYRGNQYNFYGDNFLNSPFNNWWIMWTPWEITTYSHGEEPFLLNRSGEKLDKVLVLDEHNTLGLIWADKMTVLFPYYFVNHTLFNQPPIDAAADSQNRVLYFSGKINGQDGLWKMSY